MKMTKKILTLALMLAFLAPIALTAAHAAPAQSTNQSTLDVKNVKEGQKRPKPAPTPRRPGGPPGSDDE
jgi:hypothetical protein